MKKMLPLSLYLINLAVIFYFWNLGSGDLLWKGADVYLSLGRLAALLLTLSVLSQLMLIGRVTWIEGMFGLDKLSRVHKWNGYTLSLFLVAHPVFVILSYAHMSGTNFWAQFVFMFQKMEDISGAVLAVLGFATVIAISVAIVRRRLKYESWYYVHLFTYVGILLAFGHQLDLGGDFLASKIFTAYWYVLYAFVATHIAYFRFLRPLYFSYKHAFEVEKVERETTDTVSIYITGQKLNEYPAKPGQFIILRFLSFPFWLEAHPFSLSEVPHNNRLRITPKAVGDFTSKLSSLKPGTKIFIDGPYGTFTEAVKKKNKTLLIAGGVGITPIRSLSETLARKEKDLVLLYGNRNAKNIIFKREIDELSQAGSLTAHYIMSDDPDWQGDRGYIDKAKIERLVPDVGSRDIFLCGPKTMMKSVRKALNELNIPKSQIHFEQFSL